MKKSRIGKNGRQDYHNAGRDYFFSKRQFMGGMSKPMHTRSGKDSVLTYIGALLMGMFNRRRFAVKERGV